VRQNLDWLDEALCREVDPNIFFPEAGEGSRTQTAQAVSVCMQCAVIADCFQYAKKHSRGFGIWAGGIQSTLRGRPPAEIDHGSEAGAKQHIRRGEKPCGSCRRGASLANAIRVEKRRA
jgi:WhiB family redox-sensing transcriptional regulator